MCRGLFATFSGAVVADATVTVTNEPKGIKRSLTTNDAGVFNAPALTPAEGYRVTVEKTGFRKLDTDQFTVEVGQNVNFNLNLVVATDATTIDVTDIAPLIETTGQAIRPW